MGTKNSNYTRTERVLTAVKRLLGEPGWVSVAELARLTHAHHSACHDDLELVRKFLTLEEVGEPEPRWVMPGRKVDSRDRVAYELAAQGLTWDDVSVQGKLASRRSASSARRHALRERLPWPPAKTPSE